METSKNSIKKTFKPNYEKKAEINNEIIQFQGKFKQAKIGTVRKIVDKLKHSDRNPKQNRAAKAERYENVLNQIKQMSPKRLGILALLYYKSGKNYLADTSSTLEQLAVGYFCEHKGVCGILNAIRNKLKLDSSKYWMKPARKLFKKKDPTQKEGKANKAKTSFIESDATNSKVVSEAKVKNVKQKSEKMEIEQKQKQNDLKPNDPEELEESSESDEDVKEIDVIEPPTTVDEFFITADGTNYLSTAVITRKQEKDTQDDTYHGNVFGKKPQEASFFHKNDNKPGKLASNRFDSTKRKFPNDSEEHVHKVKETRIDTELHPSWQAKQKLKPTITEFKGKKITFD